MDNLFLDSDYKSLLRFTILGMIFSLNGCVYACIPIIFYRPQFYCFNEPTSDGTTYQRCEEQDACNTGFGYKVASEYPQINSLSMEFELYCEKKIIEATTLTVMAAGQIFAFIIGTTVFINPKRQYGYFIQGSFITGISLIATQFINSPYLLFPSLFIWNVFFGLYLSVIFAYLNFFFSGALSKLGPSVYNTAWPAFMLIYCLFTYYYGYWRDSLVLFAGIPYIIFAFLLIYLRPDQPKSVTKLTPDINQLTDAPKDLQLNQQQQMEGIQNENTQLVIKETSTNEKEAPTQFHFKKLATPSSKSVLKALPNQISKKQKSITSHFQKSKKLALNKRLLDFDSHEITINLPASAQVFSIGQSQNQKEQQNQVNPCSNSNETTASPSLDNTNSPQKNQSSSSWEDFKNQLKSIKSNKRYLNNIIIFILSWLGTNIAYFGCLLVMSDLGGNIYTNISMSTVFEFLGNVVAALLLMKFPQRKILRISFLTVGLSYMICLVFDPTKQEVGQGYTLQIIISLIPIVIAKGTHELLWTVLQTYLNTILPVEFHQFSFACSNLISMIVMDLLPFYKFLMESLNFNQFFGYAVYCLFSFYIISFFQDLYTEDGKPICPAEPSDVEMHIIETDYFIQREKQKERLKKQQDLKKHIALTLIQSI